MFVCPYFPHVWTQEPVGGISWNLNVSYDIERKSKIVLFFYEKSVVKPLQRTNLLGGSVTSADTEMR